MSLNLGDFPIVTEQDIENLAEIWAVVRTHECGVALLWVDQKQVGKDVFDEAVAAARGLLLSKGLLATSLRGRWPQRAASRR